ncbi:MAG TPA: oxygenase MpaB family protein [Acidimicrobiales bacterium]|nr:oxygenase MpaB family protein [Acidimicrobiales bacterium]
MADRGRWTDAKLDPMRDVGDKPADDIAASVLAGSELEHVNDIFRTLVRTNQPVPRELPDDMEQFLNTTIELPRWAKPDRIARAQSFFQIWGVHITTCLFCASLPSAYAAGKGVRVLAYTGRLQKDAKRRVLETGQFLMDVLTPGGLEDTGNGRRTIQHVRLMHAAIRQSIEKERLRNPASWDPHWGTPINQEDLAGTLLSFAYVPAEPLRKLGIEVSRRTQEDYLHLWKVVGEMLGVLPEMRIHDMDDATQLVNAIRERQYEATEEGKELTAALIELVQTLTPGPLDDPFVPTLMRYLIGNDVAAMIDVPTVTPPLVRFVPRWMGRVFGRGERLVDRSERLQRLVEPIGRELLDNAFRMVRGGTRPAFDIPAALATPWAMPKAVPTGVQP